MGDPSINAAQKAWKRWVDEGETEGTEGDLAVDAARAALSPVRAWYEWWKPYTGSGLPDQAWGELHKLLYYTEEPDND